MGILFILIDKISILNHLEAINVHREVVWAILRNFGYSNFTSDHFKQATTARYILQFQKTQQESLNPNVHCEFIMCEKSIRLFVMVNVRFTET